jgi:hypothetical protein
MNQPLVLGAALALGLTAFASQETKEAASPTPDAKAMALMAPGEEHKALEVFVGRWALEGQWRAEPDAAWEKFTGTIEREWILDERFVREDLDSEWMDQPFKGISFLGYDNVREEYVMTWLDNASTGIGSFTGEAEGNGRRWVFEGTNSNPMTGQKDAWSRSVIEIADKDRHVIVATGKDDSGKEFEMGKMTLERK